MCVAFTILYLHMCDKCGTMHAPFRESNGCDHFGSLIIVSGE